MSASFLTAVFADAIDNPNYFNGKLLTARDMRDEQTANRQRARRLGQAIGEGVAAGLFVQASGDNLVVSAGIAVNRQGDVLLLSADQTLDLSPTAPVAGGPTDSPFRPCVALPTVTPINAGLYLLALTLASDLSREQAPHSGLNEVNAACVSRYETQGVQFKLVPIPSAVFPVGSLDTAATRLLQSRLAAVCFGVATTTAQATRPFAAPDAYGLVDELRARGELAACDVPLAVLRYAGGLRFVDSWAVRRPCLAPLSSWPPAADATLPATLLPQHLGRRRDAEARAMLLQFQTQLATLQGGDATSVRAAEQFAVLPAAGYLPGAATFADSRARGLFWWPTFFGDDALPLSPLDPAFLRAVLAESFAVDPIVLSAGTTPPVELFQLSGAPAEQPMIVFVRRMPVVVRPAAPPEPAAPAAEPATPTREGTVVIAVKDRAGKTLRRDDVRSVAVARPGGKTIIAEGAPVDSYGLSSVAVAGVEKRFFKAQAANAYASSYVDTYERLAVEKTAAGSSSAKIRVEELVEKLNREQLSVEGSVYKSDLAVYRFNLAPGEYIVSALPVDSRLLSAGSERVRVTSGGTTSVELRFGVGVYIDPNYVAPRYPKYKVLGFDDRITLLNGSLIDQIYVDKKWRDPGYVDPAPEWRVAVTDNVREAIEQTLGDWLPDEPGVATAGAGLFVNPAYTPGGAPSENPYAFIGTADGRFFPVVLVGGQHSLNGEVPVTRGGLADFGTDELGTGLRGEALENLDALSGAWGQLLANTLQLDTRGGTALVGEARAAATELQSSFARYPGVSAAAGAALGQKYRNDAELANATPAEVEAQLNSAGAGTFTPGFAARLVERARANVPPTVWSLDTVATDRGTRAKLAELGLESKGAFNARVNAGEGEALRGALGLSESTFSGLVGDVQSALVAGALRLTPDAGVAGVAGVSRDQAELLVSAGVANTGAELARASRDEVAAALAISTDEASTLIGNAAASTRELDTLKTIVGLSDETVAGLQERGVRSLAELAVADRGALSAEFGAVAGRGASVAAGAVARDISFRFRFG